MCYPEQYPEETELIIFDRTNDRGAFAEIGNTRVYVDYFSGIRIEKGESWHCRLIG